MTLPKDPIMLLSYINTQLRDNYASLRELCEFNGLDENAIIATLAPMDYHYDEDQNRFM